MTFEELWEKEERQGLQQRLRQDYHAWQRRRRQRITVACTVALLVAIVLPTILYTQPIKRYDSIACNRSGIANTHWIDVASSILTIETI